MISSQNTYFKLVIMQISTTSCYLFLSTALLASTGFFVEGHAGGPCLGDCTGTVEDGNKVCHFNVKVNLFAGELGYFSMDQCGEEANPTLGIEKGATYYFSQEDESNYYHPLGLAYYPDGAHDGVDELEPGVSCYIIPFVHISCCERYTLSLFIRFISSLVSVVLIVIITIMNRSLLLVAAPRAQMTPSVLHPCTSWMMITLEYIVTTMMLPVLLEMRTLDLMSTNHSFLPVPWIGMLQEITLSH